MEPLGTWREPISSSWARAETWQDQGAVGTAQLWPAPGGAEVTARLSAARKQEIIKTTEQLIEAVNNGDFEAYA